MQRSSATSPAPSSRRKPSRRTTPVSSRATSSPWLATTLMVMMMMMMMMRMTLWRLLLSALILPRWGPNARALIPTERSDFRPDHLCSDQPNTPHEHAGMRPASAQSECMKRSKVQAGTIIDTGEMVRKILSRASHVLRKHVAQKHCDRSFDDPARFADAKTDTGGGASNFGGACMRSRLATLPMARNAKYTLSQPTRSSADLQYLGCFPLGLDNQKDASGIEALSPIGRCTARSNLD